jgi:carboxyl-terminal processing protease
MDKARKCKALILDLRGNGGGYEETLLRLIGNLFERDVTLGDAIERKGHKVIVAKTRGKDAFKGQLVVLVDSGSGSSAELLARVVQLEKRGTVVGDRSAGAVMRAQHISYTEGQDTVVFYGLSVTVADLIMTDGKSLEKVGVTPDELLLPTPEDLAAQRDPVLSRAAALIGIKLEAERAATLFPVEWRN